MRIRIITTVLAPFKVVSGGFNRELFDYLLAFIPLTRVNRYEGQQPGDIIDISIAFPFFQKWTVIIKESWGSYREYGFADRGLRMPLGIKYWQHIHRVVARNNTSSFVIDDIEFETSAKWLDYIIYIPLLLMFYPRKLQYKWYFKKYTSTEF